MPSSSAFRTTLAVGCALAALALAGCSGSTAGPATTTSSTTGSATTSAAETTSASPSGSPTDSTVLALKMADTSLGSIVVDGAGMTLYMFTKDSPNTSACEGPCLTAWPPLIGVPTQGAGIDDSKLGSFTRADGRVQATYNSWPLYYWMNDAKPGDVTGQNVQTVWFVLDRDGAPIK